MQGDAYEIEVTLLDLDDNVIDAEQVEDVEIVLGNIRKQYADGGLTYRGEAWIYPLSQSETLALSALAYPFQARVKFVGGEVVGAFIDTVYVKRSGSKRVL